MLPLGGEEVEVQEGTEIKIVTPNKLLASIISKNKSWK